MERLDVKYGREFGGGGGEFEYALTVTINEYSLESVPSVTSKVTGYYPGVILESAYIK